MIFLKSRDSESKGYGFAIKGRQTEKQNILCLIRDFSILGSSYLGWAIVEVEMHSEVSTRTTTFRPLLVVTNH